MTIGLLRIKLVLAEYGRPLVWVLLLTGLLAVGAAGWVYANPPTTQVTEETNQQTIETAVNTSATVTGNSSLWTTGTQLTDKPIYPAAAPRLTLTLRTTVPAGEPVRVTHRLSLLYRASREDTTFWTDTRRLLDHRTTTSGGTVTAETTIDIPAIRDKLDRYNEDLTGLGRVQPALALTVEYETQRYSGTLTERTGLAIAHSGYWLDEPLAVRTTHSEQVTRTVEAAPDQTLVGGLTGVGILMLGGAGGIWYYRDQDIDHVSLQERLDRNRFEEWISEGRLNRPPGPQDIPVASLSDLVDIAIDSNKRVIHDPERQRYAVVDGRVAYRFDPYDDRSVTRDDGRADQIQDSVGEPSDGLDRIAPDNAWDDLLANED